MNSVHQCGEPRRQRAAATRAQALAAQFMSQGKKWLIGANRAPVLFTVSSVGLSVIQLISGLVVTHYVDPHDMGLWASINMALVYGFFLLAGVQNGLSRELPYYLGADNEDVACRLAATTLFYTFGTCILAFAGGVGAVVLLVYKHADPRVIYTVIAVTALLVLKFYQNYLFLTYRSNNSFVDLSRVQVKTAVAMIIALPLVLAFGYGGSVMRAVIAAGASVYWMHRSRPLPIRPAWKTESFFMLIRTGLPIYATDYITTCAATLDKVALLQFGGVESVGLYSLALSAASAVAVIPQSIAHYVYPRMSHRYGRTNSALALWDMAWKTTLTVTGIMVPIAVGGGAILPIAVKLLFPKYIAGVYAAQIALFSSVAGGIGASANALSSLKSWSFLFTYQLSYAGFLAAGPFVGVHLFRSALAGVAYGVLAANVLGAVLGLALTYAATHRKYPTDFDILVESENSTETVAIVEQL